MIWLFISIVFSTTLFVVFKFAARHKIHILPLIITNYFTCFITGNLIPGHQAVFDMQLLSESWVLPVACMGFLFITGFYSMGFATKKAGAASTSVASKMSVIIPALVSIFLFREKLEFLQYLGIAISIFSVYLMVEPAENNNRLHKGLGLLFLVFMASGMVDTGLNLVGHYYGKTTDVYTTSTIMFGAAGILGLILFFSIKIKEKFGWRELVCGVILGWLNYISLIGILNGLIFFKGKTAWFLAVNNIGIVALSTILAAIFFGERLHKSGYWGLVLALVAIITLNFHAFF